MRAHDKVEVFDVYKALKMPNVYEEKSAIIVIDLEAEAKLLQHRIFWSEHWWMITFTEMLRHMIRWRMHY